MNATQRVLLTVAPVYQKQNVYGVKTRFITDHIVSIDVHLAATVEDAIGMGIVLENANLVFLEINVINAHQGYTVAIVI
jgi:hypothetical protein